MVESALMGDPPATQNDFFIVRGMLSALGLLKVVDPADGLQLQPPRPPPDEYRYESNDKLIIASCSASVAAMVAITGTRFMLRVFKRNLKWGWDDWLMIPGAILLIAWPSLLIAQCVYGGLGRHLYDISYMDYYRFRWMGGTTKLIFYVGVGFCKMSMTIFNMRLTGLTSHKWNIAHWTFFSLLICYMIIAIFMNIFQCDSVARHWDSIAAGKSDKPLKCMTETVLGSVLSAMHVVMDFCLLAVPILVIWRVQMPWSTKARFMFILAIGLVSAIGACMRLYEQSKFGPDVLYTYVRFTQWSLVDITFGIIAVNLPTISILLPQHWLPRQLSKSRMTSSTSKSYSKNTSSVKRTGTLGQPQFTKQSKHKSQDWMVVADPEDAPSVPDVWDKESQSAGIVHDIGFELTHQDASRQNSCVESEHPETTKSAWPIK